jgi:hypothetical protein
MRRSWICRTVLAALLLLAPLLPPLTASACAVEAIVQDVAIASVSGASTLTITFPSLPTPGNMDNQGTHSLSQPNFESMRESNCNDTAGPKLPGPRSDPSRAPTR